MRVNELTEEQVPAGTRIRVIGVAPSEAEQLGYCNDTDRLMGETGTVTCLSMSSLGHQLWLDWDNEPPGTLMLAGNDEVEVLDEVGDHQEV